MNKALAKKRPEIEEQAKGPANDPIHPEKVRADEDLMRAYQEGEVAAFRILVERHQGPIYRFCLRSMGDSEAATDAAQDIFLKVVKNAAKWQQKAKFTTWLYTIARNHCIDASRKKKHRKTESLNAPLGRDAEGGEEKIDRVTDESPDSTRLLDSKRMREVIDEALEEMPPEQREVFCLRQYSGLPFAEIAEATKTGENTVKSRMRYALKALQKALLTAGFEPPDTS
jgi:RNA polymerase sigma-70 factor (ECF subfamily)